MKQFRIKLAVFLLALALPFLAAFLWIQAQPAMFATSLMGSSWYKLQLLESTPSPKIVVVGGSSVPYGIVSEEMHRATGLPCVNLGATAYLGVEYYLAQLHGNIGPGDIVIIAPEYAMLDDSVNYSTCWMAVENHPGVMAKLPPSYWPGMVKSYWNYAVQKLDLLRQHSKNEPVLTPAEAYAASDFGPWGDITLERENILEQKYNAQDCRFVDAQTLSPDFVKSVNRFARYAEKNGARVYLTYAPFDRLALEGGLAGVQALEDAIKSQCAVPYLGSLLDGVMHEDYFFDSNNHLNSVGARIRTQALVDDLAAAGAISR